jgi:O-antigen ligase/polysaccharide polymerase Wzy-like membrane protein/tetratricopeptide repeat protein
VQRIVIPWHAARRIGHRIEHRAGASRPPPLQTVVAAAVAVLYVALAVANGGYSSELTAGATVAIWWAVVIALALGGWPRSRVPAAALGAGVCLGALATLTAISVGWASDDGGTFVEIVRALGYLGVFVLVVIASPRASARTWLGGVALGLVVVAGLALLSRFEPSFGGAKELGAFLPSAAARLSYPIGYWNGLAAVMAIALVLLVWLGGQARAPAVRAAAVAAIPLPILVVYLASSRGGVAAGAIGLAVLLGLGPARAQMLGGLVIGGIGGALLVSLTSHRHELVDALGNSTAAAQGDQMLALSIGVVLAVGILRFVVDDSLRKVEVPARAARAVGAAVAIAAIAGILLAGPSTRWQEFKQVAPLETKSTYVAAHLTSGRGSGRYQYWSSALDAFEDHPLRGIGAGGYEAFWGQHGSLARPIRDAHSLFFEAMAELGITGLMLVLGFLGFAAVSGSRRGPTRSRGGALGAALAILAAGIVSAAIDWTWELPACFGLVVLAAALLTGPATLGPEPVSSAVPHAVNGRRARPSRRRPSRFGLGVATLLVGWAAIWAGGVLFLTEVKLGDSRAGASARDLESAAQDARDASTIQPWAAEPRLQLALVEELEGDLQAANRDLGEAIQRAPDDWQLWFVRARLEVKSGDVSAARQALERARQLNPRAPFLAQ